MMFIEALLNFMKEVEAQSGMDNGIVKITLASNLFERVVFELGAKRRDGSPKLSGLNELQIYNVLIVKKTENIFDENGE